LADLMPESVSYKKGAKPPRFNKYELFDRLAFETVILTLALRRMINGATLSVDDLIRVLQAESTINDIVRECRR